MFDRAINIFCGKIVDIQKTLLVTQVTVSLPSSVEIISIITTESFDSLDISTGDIIYCSIKPTEILVAKSETFPKVSTRNCFLGELVEVNTLGVTGEVVGNVGSDTYLRSVVTIESMQALDLQKGDAVYFYFKGFSVILTKL